MSSATMKEIPKEVRLKISQTLVGEYCGEKSPNSIYNEEQIKNVIKDLLNPHLKLNEIATKNSVENNYNRNVNDENKTSSKTFKEQMELLNYTYMNDLAREIMLLPQKIFNTYSLDVLPSKELIKNYFGYIDTMIKL